MLYRRKFIGKMKTHHSALQISDSLNFPEPHLYSFDELSFFAPNCSSFRKKWKRIWKTTTNNYQGKESVQL
jgi:hypothetical protein